MAGTWMSVIEGFAGKRIQNGKLVLNPQIPEKWKAYTFKIIFRGSLLKIIVQNDFITICNESDIPACLLIYGNDYIISGNKQIRINSEENVYIIN